MRLKQLAIAGSLVAMIATAQGPEDAGRGVARLSVINGDVSVRRGDSGDWVAAAVNGPLVVEDRVQTGVTSRAEVQFDWANMIRLSADSEIRLSELANRRFQVQIARGLATFSVLRNSEADVELSTPFVSVRPIKGGDYRILVQPEQTEITVRSGEAEVFTPRGVERLTSNKTMIVRGTASDPEFQTVRAYEQDNWDRWNQNRNRDLERSGAYRYVHRDVYGAEDLDGHGRWVSVPDYGWVWTPRVAVGWAPYRLGRWSWIDWYGWSWVSYDPWGWAPYHYGRWFNTPRYGWCWYPGGLYTRQYWSPGLVAWFGWGGGGGVGIGFGRVGWVPLAPYERFYPWWGRGYYGGRGYRGFGDNSVNIVNNVNITNVYRNARVTNGVTAVGATDFSRGRIGNGVRLSGDDFSRASAVRGQVPIAPERESLRMTDREVRQVGRGNDDQRFFSRRPAAAVERVSFDDQRRGVAELSRRTFEPQQAGRTEQRAADQRAPEQRSGRADAADGGWRRVGEAGARDRTEAQTLNRPDRTESSRGADWRRFGEPSQRSTVQREAARPDQGVQRGATRTESRDAQGGWRRFGEPRSNETVREVERVPFNREGARTQDSGRSRFSEQSPRERTEVQREPSRTESGNSRQFERQSQGDSDRGSFQRTPAPERTNQRQFGDFGRSERIERQRDTGRQESIRLNPPVVRERSVERGNFGGSVQRSERSGGGGERSSGGGVSRSSESPRGGGEGRSGGRNR